MNRIIVDGLYLAFRSHFAHITLQTQGGRVSGCIYGFLIGLRGLKKKNPASHITVAWDSSSSRRKTIYAEYKANRSPMAFPDQIRDLKRILYTLNVAQIECVGEEADDVIASFVNKYKGDGLITIFSADKDLLQLVEDGKVIMLRPSSGKNPEKYFDEALVLTEYKVTPKEMKAFLSFRGDVADNIPGARRVRAVVLIRLLRKFKNPMDIFKHLQEEKLTDYERDTLTSFEKQASINLDLVSLRGDLKLNIIDGIPDIERLAELILKYELKSFKPQNLVDVFTDLPSHIRNGPAIQSYSLF